MFVQQLLVRCSNRTLCYGLLNATSPGNTTFLVERLEREARITEQYSITITCKHSGTVAAPQSLQNLKPSSSLTLNNNS